MVDVAGAVKADPLALSVKAAVGEFLACEAVEIELAAGNRRQHLGHGELDEAKVIDAEAVVGGIHCLLLDAVARVGMNALLVAEDKSIEQT